MDKKKMFLGIALFWLLIILSFIFVKEYTLSTGKEIIFKTRYYDPRDLFRGDYVVLNYEVSSIDLNKVYVETKEFSAGETVYVTLDPKNSTAEPLAVSKKRMPKDYGPCIKGKITSVMSQGVFAPVILVEYGIENYFVPEGEGSSIRSGQGRGLEARVSLDSFCNAVIKDLLMDGVVVQFNAG
ncbi:MAG: GDYXXLXY domain-containing protein [archaeon]